MAIQNLNEQVGDIKKKSETARPPVVDERSLNIVIFGLKELPQEDVCNKINKMLRDDLKLRAITVEKAERKRPRQQNATGIIIAKCRSAADKEEIMRIRKILEIQGITSV